MLLGEIVIPFTTALLIRNGEWVRLSCYCLIPDLSLLLYISYPIWKRLSRTTRRYFSRARSYMYWWKRDPPQAGNMNILLIEWFGFSFKKQAAGWNGKLAGSVGPGVDPTCYLCERSHLCDSFLLDLKRGGKGGDVRITCPAYLTRVSIN